MRMLRIGFAFGATLLFTACLDTRPTSRIHAAASVPRFVAVNSFSFEEEGPKPGFVAGLGAGYGTAWSDVGNVYGAQIYHADFHFQGARYAVGWRPYMAVAQVSTEGRVSWGSTLWGALYFGGGPDWRFSGQASFTYGTKTAEESGCQNATETIFFGAVCDQQSQSFTRSQVIVRDAGLVLTAEKRLGPKSSLVFAPSAHWTYIVSSNHLDSSTAADFIYRTQFWSPGLQVGYVWKFGEKLATKVIFMAGAEYAKTFRPDRVVREWVPSADIRFQF